MFQSSYYTSEPTSPVRHQVAALHKQSTFVTYNNWSAVLKLVLQDNQLWDSVQNAPHSTTAEEVEQDKEVVSRERDGKATFIIRQNMDEEFVKELACSTSAADLWAEIWLRFNYKREREGEAAKREFYGLKKGILNIDTLRLLIYSIYSGRFIHKSQGAYL